MTGERDDYRFGIIADAHFHDLDVDFGFSGFQAGDRRLVMRPLSAVARSPRIYNEAGQALRHTLDAMVDRGIRDVVLLGDYSDDGQKATLAALAALLGRYRQAHGMRFLAVPGNHDIFGGNGRHRRKRYLAADGGEMLVTSDPDFEPERGHARIVSPAMHCGGYPENLPADCGFFGVEGAVSWETPFGRNADPQARTFEIRSRNGRLGRRLMDASYMVEPRPGLFFAMVDANVFVPDTDGDDGLADSTAAGWNAVLRHKPFILDWLRGLARRARESGGRLIVFSHYPVLDPLDGTLGAERAMMAPTSFHARIPPPEVGSALLEAGVRFHFGGHVHVNDTARMTNAEGAALVNVAVPSLVAFPAAAKIVTLAGSGTDIDTLSLDSMPLDPVLAEAYRTEHALNGVDTGEIRSAKTYGDFVCAHLRHVTRRRFLKREWPTDLADRFRTGDLLELTQAAGLNIAGDDVILAAGIGAVDFLADWYALRMGGALGRQVISSERLDLYRRICAQLDSQAGDATEPRLRLLLQTLDAHLEGLPDRYLRLDAEGGLSAGPQCGLKS